MVVDSENSKQLSKERAQRKGEIWDVGPKRVVRIGPEGPRIR
jgi:hypothetical protein